MLINSLKWKILSLVTVIVVAVISVIAVVNYQLQKRMIYSIAKHDSKVLTETINNSIAASMLSGKSGELFNLLDGVKNLDSIRSVRILDSSSRIIYSSDTSETGKMVSRDELSAIQLRNSNFPTLRTGDNNFSVFSIINNESACFGCHDPARRIIGILQITMSLDFINNYLADFRSNAMMFTILLVILIITALALYLVHAVDKPVGMLVAAMNKVENGDYSSKPVLNSSTEMNLLSTNYNAMVERLESQMAITVMHERELARAQEKLSHHNSIHELNEKLEVQIKEIEDLNISLEERIEEIEEANFKISDLAGELEDKNTNLKKAVAKLSTLYKVGLAINSTMEKEPLFTLIVKTTMETLHAEIGYILLYEPGIESFRVTTLLGHDFASHEESLLPMKPSSVSAWVIKNRKSLLITDINEAPQFDRFSSLGYERKTLICAPLLVKDEIIGTITVVNKLNQSVYNTDELELLNTIAAQAGIAIKNAQLYDEQQVIYMNTIHALVSAIEANDSMTRGHSERVTLFSIELARKLAIPPERMKIIERAAILHDIGKIGIDLSLLHKEEQLSPTDVCHLREHPAIGMKILDPIDFLQDVKICIGQHHERFDGHGYPNQLEGDDLLIESRILAIADAFDAMTSDRPYRKALPIEDAISELVNNAGTQFDPRMVPHFVELLQSGAFSSCKDGEPDAPPFPAGAVG
jgi:putative nucleotidyltransferase with HDIG domain